MMINGMAQLVRHGRHEPDLTWFRVLELLEQARVMSAIAASWLMPCDAQLDASNAPRIVADRGLEADQLDRPGRAM